MKRKILKDNKVSELKLNPESTLVTWGLILKLPLESIPSMKEMILQNRDTRIILQRVSAGRLLIIEENTSTDQVPV